MTNSISQTVNSTAATFVEGTDYVLFNGNTGMGTVAGTFAASPNTQTAGNTEGGCNGL